MGLLVGKIRSMSDGVFESARSRCGSVRRELLRLAMVLSPLPGIDPAPIHYRRAIGSHREAVSREFAPLEAENVVRVSGEPT